MLKSRVIDNDIIINSLITAQDYSSDRDYYNNKLLNLGALSVINSINDSEVYEFKPNANELNFNIFFLRYMQTNEINEITPYIESNFITHVNKTKIELGITNSAGVNLGASFNNIFEVRQADTNLREPKLKVEKNEAITQSLEKKPYVSFDKVGESLLLRPVKSGIPVFYNSYTIPFWDKKNEWVNNDLLYTNKPYFNNSFMLMEFYDSPSPLNQNRILSTPVFVNSRYNIKELTNNRKKSVIHERPCFKLKNGSDGFSFFFLNNFIKNDFYVKFSFWDAANGNKIPLLPSCENEKSKKWFQDVNKFKQEFNYLKYVLDYTNKTYKIYEYNTQTNDFDLERVNFDLYELAFDPYFNNVFISNDIPIDASTLKPVDRPFCPLKFSVRNLYTDKYLGDSVSIQKSVVYTKSSTPLYSYLSSEKHTGRFLDKMESYIKSIPSKTITNLPESEFVYPTISNYRDPIKINGFVHKVQKLIASNVDTDSWKIRKLSLQDVSVIIDDHKIYDKTYYLEMESSWERPNRDRISESMTLMLNGTTDSISTSSTANDLIYKLMTSVDFIEYVINYFNDELDKEVSTINSNGSFQSGFSYLGQLMQVILDGMGYVETFGVAFYGYDYDYNTKRYVYYNQLSPYKNDIISQYKNLVAYGDSKVSKIRKDVINVLKNVYEYYDKVHEHKTVDTIVDYIFNNFDSFQLSGMVDDYIAVANNNQVDTSVKNELDKIYNGGEDYVMSQIDDNPGLRDYLLNFVVIQDSDRFISENETIGFTINVIIGKNTKQLVYGATSLSVMGKLKISLIDEQSNIKNIFVPINIKLKPGSKPKITPTTIIPQINLTAINI